MNLAINTQTTERWYKSGKVYPWIFWFIVAVIVVTPRILDLNEFYIRDELAIWNWSDEFTQAIWAGDMTGTLTTSDYPGIPLFWVQTAFLTFKYTFPGLFPHTLVPPDHLKDYQSINMLAERRLATSVFLSLQIMAMVLLVRHLFGIEVALLSAILLGLDPFSLTEARALRLEMISASFVCLSVLSYFFYLQRRQRRWLLISGAMAGLGVSSKTSAGLVVPYIWLLLALDFLFLKITARRVWLEKLRALLVNGLLWAAGAVAAFWLIWPAMWIKPVEALTFLFRAGFSQATGRSVWGDKIFFLGQIVDGGDPGPLFYPVVLAFRTTPLMWIGLLGALLLIGWTLAQRRKISASGPNLARLWGLPWLTLGALLLLAYVVLVIVEMTFIISKVDRFLLIIFQPLSILSAIGLVTLIHGAARRLAAGRRRWATAGLIGAVLAAQLWLTIPVHPHYFTYWNPWLGGGAAAMEMVPLGAGEGIDLAMNFLNAQPNAKNSSVVCGGSQPWCSNIYHGKTLRFATYFDGQWVTADYATMYISHLQRKRYPQAVIDFLLSQTPLYQVDLQGATYTWVYKTPDIDVFAGPWNTLTGLAQLLGYSLKPAPANSGAVEVTPGQTVTAKVWWINEGAGVDRLVLRWIDRTGFEWGRARVEPLSNYASVAAEKRAIVSGTATLTIPPETPPGQYFLRLGVTADDGALIGDFKMPDDGNRLAVRPGAPLTNPLQVSPATRLEQRLSPELVLFGYTLPSQVINSQTPAWLSLYWQALNTPADYTVTVRLRDSSGQVVARWQDRPGYGQYPFSAWPAGSVVKDVWALQVEPEVPLGKYRLEIALLAPGGGTEVNLVSLGTVEVWPQPVRYERPKMQGTLDATFGNRLTLLGYDLYFDTGGSSNGTFAPIFYWQSQANFEDSFDVLVSLVDAQSGQTLKSWRNPLGKGPAKTVWKAGEVIDTPYRFETGALSGAFHLDVALVDRASGKVVPAKTQQGQTVDAVRIENIQNKITVRVQE